MNPVNWETEKWCDCKVKDSEGIKRVSGWVTPVVRKWETNKAVITDLCCPHCDTAFDRKVVLKESQ